MVKCGGGGLMGVGGFGQTVFEISNSYIGVQFYF